MSDVNKSSGLPMPESEADWVIDLDKLAEETGTSPALSVVSVPPTEASSPNPLLAGMTGTEFFRLASEAATDLSLAQVAKPVSHPESAPSPRSQSYQELQQQNEQLLDWVGELEESLNQCQTALQFQRQRSQELEAIVAQRQKSDSSANLEASFNRTLQESQQQVQKHKILVETLTQQLDNSKDRVTHLEQEYASLQKRFADQTQRLVQSENECRSLKTRLSRQQRYTLQFKAALERCLEVSVPLPADFDTSDDCKPAATALPEPVTFFPRSSPVQPWSAPEGVEDTPLEGSWHKVTQWVDPHLSEASDQPGEMQETLEPTAIDLPPSDQVDPEEAIVAPSMEQPILDSSILNPPIPDPSIPDPAIVDPPIVDPRDVAIDQTPWTSITPTAEQTVLETSLEDLPNFWTDEQPEITSAAPSSPAESLGSEFFRSESSGSQSSDSQSSSSESLKPRSSAQLPFLPPLDALDAALQAAIDHAPPVTPPEDSRTPSAEPYQLWQTLAQAAEEPSLPPGVSPPPAKSKLITFPRSKVSFDLQASEVRAETEPDRPLVADHVHPDETQTSDLGDLTDQRDLSTLRDLADRPNAVSAPIPPVELDRELVAVPQGSPESRGAAESSRRVAANPLLHAEPSLNLQPSWPSPLVYPLRPPKKRDSLAAIELPRFPRQ